MKEYRIPEDIIKKIMKRNLIVMSSTFLVYLIFFSIYAQQIGANVEMIIFTDVSSILFISVALFFGYKLGKKRLRVMKLILDDEFLIWVWKSRRSFQINYSDIKRVKIHKNKGIIIKLRKSFKKIYILKFIEDLENVFQLIQNKVNMY